MKVAPKVGFLFTDSEGFASNVTGALLPNPPSSSRCLEESFELPLEGYGIKDHKASGTLFHYLDDHGNYQVSLLLMQNCSPPVLACAVNEVLNTIRADNSSLLPTFLVPCLISSLKLKWESKSLTDESVASVYGIKIGQETDVTRALFTRTQRPPASLQIPRESLACFLHFVCVLQWPTFVLIGKRGQSSSDNENEALYEIGELLADTTGLQFSRDSVMLNPAKKTKDNEEPWRALYG